MKRTLLPLLAVASVLAHEAAAQAPATPPATRPAGGPNGIPTGAPGAPKSAAPLVSLPAPRGNGRISGVVLDGATKKPVEFATVALLPSTGDKPVDGAVADDKGRFSLRGLAAGEYRLQLSFIGYGNVTQLVSLTESKMSLDLGSIELTATAQQLTDVTVTGERPVVESKPDRLVYNAATDNTNKGGTAADVLRKAPMVSVDPDGNLQLRGSGNVRILINGKPSAVVAGDVATALKALPGDQIKSVEVITSPSAKYDGEGSAGIINIILKENNLQGVNGNVGLALGTRNSNGNFTLNARRGKLGLSAGANAFAFYAPGDQEVDRIDKGVRTVVNGQPVLTTGRLQQRNDGNGYGGGGQGRIGLEYEPAPNHALSLSFNSALFSNNFDIDIRNRYTLDEGQPASTANPLFGNYTRQQVMDNSVRSYDLLGSYTRSFGAKSRREWTVLAQHSRNRRDSDYDVRQFPLLNPDSQNPAYREQGPNLARNLESTLQTDYVHPIGEKQTVEVGAKMIQRKVFSDYDVYRTDFSTGVFGREASLSNKYDYDQDVLAGYATYGTSLGKKYSVRLGARVERTDLRGNFQNQDDPFRLSYTNVLPNLALTRNLKQPGSSLRATYSRRIQRPSIFYLNPYPNQSDPRNIQQGNPKLDAEFTDNYELNWNTFAKGTSINVSVYSRQTNNAIERVYSTDDAGRVLATFGNVARNQTYGLNLFGSAKPLPKWDISGNISAYYVYLSSKALNTSNSGVVYSANINSGYKLGKGFSAQLFAMLNSPRIQLQGTTSPWQMYSLGMRKDLWKGKGDLTLNADNPFSSYIKLSNDFDTGQSVSTNTTYVYNRGVRVAFAYRFGKLENKPSRPKRSIRNDDQKAGDSGNGQGGGN